MTYPLLNQVLPTIAMHVFSGRSRSECVYKNVFVEMNNVMKDIKHPAS